MNSFIVLVFFACTVCALVAVAELPPNAKLVQVQIVHRHGDRTPITPMKDHEFWASTLPDKQVLDKISSGTCIIREGEIMKHGAAGSGVFGQLSSLGLFQMVDLGNRLRDELHCDVNGIFSKHRPLDAQSIRVVSTDFPRTIQSVQGLLVGLFPDGIPKDQSVDIDVRHTRIMIPDPQPRRYKLQEHLEKELSNYPKLLEKEKQMVDLAHRVTQSLRNLITHGAAGVSFGVGEEKERQTEEEAFGKPLPWGQLSEITKCLRVRDMLPEGISYEDQERIAAHAAHRWFALLRHPTLANIAMDEMISDILNNIKALRDEKSSTIPLHIYSAHDSTLIGLMCALRLEQPAEWPEYASALKLEIFETQDHENQVHHYCRFSLNGNILRCNWGSGKCPRKIIHVGELESFICEGRADIDAARQLQE